MNTNWMEIITLHNLTGKKQKKAKFIYYSWRTFMTRVSSSYDQYIQALITNDFLQ